MNQDRAQLWELLRAGGLVSGEVPPGITNGMPWYQCAMIGAASCLAAFALFAFLWFGMSRGLTGPVMSFALSLLLCVFGAVLMTVMRNFDFLRYLGLAMSFGAQWTFAAAIVALTKAHAPLGWLLTAGFQIVLALIVKYPVHRFWCLFGATVSLLIALLHV